MKEIEAFFTSLEEPNRSCMLALRQVILDFDPDITETWKYRMPCYCYRGKVFCYLWIDKKSKNPYILIVRGKEIEHPNLERGDRSKMQRLVIQPNEDLPLELINEILELAKKQYQ